VLVGFIMSSLSNVPSDRLQDIREAAAQIAALKDRLVELENFVASALQNAEQPTGLPGDNIIAFPASLTTSSIDSAEQCGAQSTTCEVVPLPRALRTLLLNPPLRPAQRTDDLTLIKGIDSDQAALLANEGFTRYADIADLTSEAVKDLSAQFALEDSINRQNWIEQAAILAKGKRTAFAATIIETRRKDADNVTTAETADTPDEPPPPRSIIIATEPLAVTDHAGEGFLPKAKTTGAKRHRTIAHRTPRPQRDWGPWKAMMASLACTAVIAVSGGVVQAPSPALPSTAKTSAVSDMAQGLGAQGLARLYRTLIPMPL
jgi:predicted flap endonuclease-1-like 5' DNA nuclease